MAAVREVSITFSDGGSEGSFSVVNVANCADVDMRFVSGVNLSTENIIGCYREIHRVL